MPLKKRETTKDNYRQYKATYTGRLFKNPSCCYRFIKAGKKRKNQDGKQIKDMILIVALQNAWTLWFNETYN